MLIDVDMSRQGNLWTKTTVYHTLRKRNLQVSNGMVVAVNTTLVAVEALSIKTLLIINQSPFGVALAKYSL